MALSEGSTVVEQESPFQRLLIQVIFLPLPSNGCWPSGVDRLHTFARMTQGPNRSQTIVSRTFGLVFLTYSDQPFRQQICVNGTIAFLQ
jgi:hypothetical protein